jgi:hypothetical protein
VHLDLEEASSVRRHPTAGETGERPERPERPERRKRRRKDFNN